MAWRLSCLSPSTTVCFFLDVGPTGSSPIDDGRLLHLQFITEYLHASGQHRIRVSHLPTEEVHYLPAALGLAFLCIVNENSGLESPQICHLGRPRQDFPFEVSCMVYWAVALY